VYSLLTYFSEVWFGDLEDRSQKSLRITINAFFMALLLCSLVMIIPRIEPSILEEHLRNYYGEMGEIFATVLAIVAAFYTAAPKNVINITELSNNCVDMFPYPRLIHRFVLLYGIMVALCLWGFTAGTTVKYDYIIDFSLSNLINLSSILVFAATLMLIPPAITNLYALLSLIILYVFSSPLQFVQIDLKLI